MSYEQELVMLKSELEKNVNLGKCLETLKSTSGWKTLMDEYYFKEFAATQVLSKADVSMSEEIKEEIDKSLIGISQFYYFCLRTEQMSAMAVEKLKQIDSEIDEAIKEED